MFRQAVEAKLSISVQLENDESGRKMIKTALMFSMSVILLSGCVSNTVNVTPEVSPPRKASEENDPTGAKGPVNNSVTVEYAKNSKPLSVIVVEAGPCPERDRKSYGILMNSRTLIKEGKVHCFYN